MGRTRVRLCLHNPVFLSVLQCYRGNRHFHGSTSRLPCESGTKFHFWSVPMRRIYCDSESSMIPIPGRTIFNDNFVDRFPFADGRSCRTFPPNGGRISVSVEVKAVSTKKCVMGIQPAMS